MYHTQPNVSLFKESLKGLNLTYDLYVIFIPVIDFSNKSEKVNHVETLGSKITLSV